MENNFVHKPNGKMGSKRGRGWNGKTFTGNLWFFMKISATKFRISLFHQPSHDGKNLGKVGNWINELEAAPIDVNSKRKSLQIAQLELFLGS